MSQKFSIVVEIKGGKPVATAYLREDSRTANEQFNQLRDAGKEAYLFVSPIEEKRSKSTEQIAASVSKEAPKASVVDSIMSNAKSLVKPRKKADADLSI